MKTTVIYHRNDFDGLFSGQIAKKFLPPDTELIGWHFGDAPIIFPTEGRVYVIDLPLDRVFGYDYNQENLHLSAARFVDASRVVWIDHHRSSIESHPKNIPGYRIDGVAACRLAWQWFNKPHIGGETCAITKEDFLERKVDEPLAVRLAGEYDVWDKRDPRAEMFQFGLQSVDLDTPFYPKWDDEFHVASWWYEMLRDDKRRQHLAVDELLSRAPAIMHYREKEYAKVIKEQGFDVGFMGRVFLACNSHECDIRSHLFAAGIKPHHEALMGFTFNGAEWAFSLYQIDGKKDVDVLSIAKHMGGGGHAGACGFTAKAIEGFQIVNGVHS
jgi:hypothetical protein